MATAGLIMMSRLLPVTLLILVASCTRTIAANSPESTPPSPPWLIADMDGLQSLGAVYSDPPRAVQNPLDTRRVLLLFTDSDRLANTVYAEGGWRMFLRFTAQDADSGVSSLHAEIRFEFDCHRPLSDGSGHESVVHGRVLMERSFTSPSREFFPRETGLFFEFSGNQLWREGGCQHSVGPDPNLRGTIQNARATYAAWASNGSALSATLPAVIEGEFRLASPVRVNLGR